MSRCDGDDWISVSIKWDVIIATKCVRKCCAVKFWRVFIEDGECSSFLFITAGLESHWFLSDLHVSLESYSSTTPCTTLPAPLDLLLQRSCVGLCCTPSPGPESTLLQARVREHLGLYSQAWPNFFCSGGHKSFLWGHWHDGQPDSHLVEANMWHVCCNSPLVWYLLTSLQLAQQLSCSLPCTCKQELVRLETRICHAADECFTNLAMAARLNWPNLVSLRNHHWGGCLGCLLPNTAWELGLCLGLVWENLDWPQRWWFLF